MKTLFLILIVLLLLVAGFCALLAVSAGVVYVWIEGSPAEATLIKFLKSLAIVAVPALVAAAFAKTAYDETK